MAKQATGPATVFIVDDDEEVRDSLGDLVRSVGLAVELFSSTEEFLARGEWSRPGCLILDVRLPGRSGLDFQDDLVRANVAVPIVFVSAHSDVPMSVRAMKAGAFEFMTKPVRPQDLLDAIHAAIERDRDVLREAEAIAKLEVTFSSLTVREREVLEQVVTGLLNKQIAAALGLSEVTVKMHRGNLMRKIGARSVADLVRMVDRLKK